MKAQALVVGHDLPLPVLSTNAEDEVFKNLDALRHRGFLDFEAGGDVSSHDNALVVYFDIDVDVRLVASAGLTPIASVLRIDGAEALALGNLDVLRIADPGPATRALYREREFPPDRHTFFDRVLLDLLTGDLGTFKRDALPIDLNDFARTHGMDESGFCFSALLAHVTLLPFGPVKRSRYTEQCQSSWRHFGWHLTNALNVSNIDLDDKPESP